MALFIQILVAVLVLPFAFGYWIGHAAFAAAPFVALGLTLLIRQVQIGGESRDVGGLVVWIVLSTVVSAAAAYAGGRTRERRRERRGERRGERD